MTAPPLLDVRDLWVEIATRKGSVHPVRGLDLTVCAGESVALVGESGSGKSITARAIMGILDHERIAVSRGEIRFRGDNLLELSRKARRNLCAEEIGMVFQEPLSALNPCFTVGFQLAELFRVRRGLSRGEARKRAADLLDVVGMPSARERLDDYPHQFSGGMRQRIVIAMALALEPSLLIADEPTTALDVTVQAVIMDLLAEVCRERRMGLLLITHDLAVVSEQAERVTVMYAGRVMETGSTTALLNEPRHPYTQALLAALPSARPRSQPLAAIPGSTPEPARFPRACPFHPRCALAVEICASEDPSAHPIAPGHLSFCHRADELVVSRAS